MPAAQRGILLQGGVGLALGVRIRHLQRLQAAGGEDGPAIPIEQFGLHAAHHDRLLMPFVGRHAARKALVVDQFEQGGEALLVAVVRRGGEKQAVLAMGRQAADGLRAQRVDGIAPAAGGGDVVRLIHDQQVKGARPGGCARRRQDFAQQAQGAVAFEKVDGGDQAREVAPGVGVQPAGAAQRLHQLAVHEAKFEAELVRHLVAPVNLQRGGADNQHTAGAVADDQLLHDQPGFDRLAKAHVVGDQQVDARHLQSAHERVELIVLDLHAAAEGGLEGAHVGGGDRAPAHGVEKGVEHRGRVKTVQVGQVGVVENRGPRLQFPDHLQLLAVGVVLDRRERDQMLGPIRGGQDAGSHIGDDTAQPAHGDQLAGFGRWGMRGVSHEGIVAYAIARQRMKGACRQGASIHRPHPRRLHAQHNGILFGHRLRRQADHLDAFAVLDEVGLNLNGRRRLIVHGGCAGKNGHAPTILVRVEIQRHGGVVRNVAQLVRAGLRVDQERFAVPVKPDRRGDGRTVGPHGGEPDDIFHFQAASEGGGDG